MAMARSLAHLFFLLLLVSTAPAVRTTPDDAGNDDNLQEACNRTLFPKFCIDSLKENPESATASTRRLAELSVYVAAQVGTTVAAFAHHELNGLKDDALYRCLDTCSDDVEEAVAHLSALTRELTDAKFLEVKAWLASTLGGASTCEEACKDAPISPLKNAAVTKSLEFEKLLRVTLDLITEASGSMSAKVALPPTAASAPSYGSPYGAPYGAPSYGAPYGAPSPGYGAPSAGAPSYGVRRPRAPAPSPSRGAAGSASDADATA